MRPIVHARMLCVLAAAMFLAATAVRASSQMDDRIASSAKNSYVFKTYLKNDNIETRAKDGAVILMGTVNEESHKSLAEETVANLPGVTRVDNQIQVKGNRPAEYSDAWLGIKVKAALLFHRNVSALNTRVDVKDGIVALSGEADSQAQKDLTGEYAKDVDGIRAMRNEIKVVEVPARTVKPEEMTASRRIDDASITAQAKMALLAHRSTSALTTRVRTTDGVVTVEGKAKNGAEKDLVTKLVTDINGVRSVVNRMSAG